MAERIAEGGAADPTIIIEPGVRDCCCTKMYDTNPGFIYTCGLPIFEELEPQDCSQHEGAPFTDYRIHGVAEESGTFINCHPAPGT